LAEAEYHAQFINIQKGLTTDAPEALPSHRQVLTIGYGQNGTLSCSVDANPKPSVYTWSKNGHFIATTTEDTLLIQAEKDSDGGIFGCQAENSVGRSPIIETHVIIAEPPVFITRPPAELRVFEGAPVSVNCEGFGDPLPIVYWRRISSATLSFPSVSHGDHGIYDCVVSNAVSTISTPMSLIVERTRPQAAVIDSVECVGDEAMAVHWTPGFNGSYPQSFVIHYESERDSSGKTLLTTSTSATIGDLMSFSKYRIQIESRNQKGSTNSSVVEKYVCSNLPAPSNVHLIGDSELRWDPVEEARSYRVESRYDKMGKFESRYSGSGLILVPGNRSAYEVLRPPYEPSLPSRPIDFGSFGGSVPSMWWAVFGGFLFFFFFMSLYLYSKYGKYIGRRKRKNKHYNDYVCPSSFQPHTETLYEPSVNL
ncbi:immunoglobulin domain protein, partial [Cooperia oncophora]